LWIEEKATSSLQCSMFNVRCSSPLAPMTADLFIFS